MNEHGGTRGIDFEEAEKSTLKQMFICDIIVSKHYEAHSFFNKKPVDPWIVPDHIQCFAVPSSHER
ncbi:MAG: hypothetical protein NTW95_06355 [Candidatus Aminicenantes bacterium]|nr:hypothetical protein [Candidatus Aminicenantes bacterium]